MAPPSRSVSFVATLGQLEASRCCSPRSGSPASRSRSSHLRNLRFSGRITHFGLRRRALDDGRVGNPDSADFDFPELSCEGTAHSCSFLRNCSPR